jgi:quinol monooxygenase YgiN
MSKTKNVVASFYPLSDQGAQVEAVLRGMVAPTRAEPGNNRYDLFKASSEPLAFHLIESYRDEDALAAHRETPHYKHYRATITPLLSQAIGVLLMDPIDTKN